MSLLLTARPRGGDTFLMRRIHLLNPLLATDKSSGHVYTGTANSLYAGYDYTSGTQHDYWEWEPLVLPPGDYVVRALCFTDANYGILHLSVDGVDTGARLDQHAGSLGWNQVLSDTFTLASKVSGPVRLAASSKTGSSYYCNLTQAALIKVSDGGDEGADVNDLPGVIDVPITTAYSASSGTWVTLQNTLYRWGTAIYNSSFANGDYLEIKVWIPAGTWDLECVHYAGTDAAIKDFLLDGVSVGTIDGYGSTVVNKFSTITGISVATTKTYTLRVAINGKNASASAYSAQLYWIQLRRTA